MKDKEYRIIIIIALVLGILALSIVFAAYTRIVTIEYNDEPTTGNIFGRAVIYSENESEKAQVVASSLSNVIDANPGAAKFSTWSGISFKIDMNATNASATFKAHVVNTSKTFDAYLWKITTRGRRIVCIAAPGTSQYKVNEVCKDMRVTVTITGANEDGVETVTYSKAADADFASGVPTQIKLARSSSEEVVLKYDYNTDKPIPDGAFAVIIPPIEFIYTSMAIGKR